LEDVAQELLVGCALEEVLERQGDEARATLLLHEQSLALQCSMRDAAVLARVGMMLVNNADHWLYHYGDERQARNLYRQCLKVWQQLRTVGSWVWPKLRLQSSKRSVPESCSGWRIACFPSANALSRRAGRLGMRCRTRMAWPKRWRE